MSNNDLDLNISRPYNYMLKGKFYFIISFSIILLGLAILFFIAFEKWVNLLVCLSILLIIPTIWLCLKAPDFIVFISLFIHFTPIEVHPGHYLTLFLVLILFIKNILLDRKILKFDIIVMLWFLVIILSIMTFPKWNSIYYGFRGSLYLYVLPLSIYILFNNYISKDGCVRFFKFYYPLLLTFIILQIIYIYIVGEASQSKDVMSYHSGFNLVWGRSNYTAAVIAYLSIIVFSTRRFWLTSYVKKIMISSSLFIAFVGIIVIVSRGTILALFAGLISILIIYRKNIIKSWYWLIGISIISLIGGLLLVDFIIKIIERFKYMKFDLSFLTRLYMYKDLLVVLKNNLFIGVGPEQYRYTDFYTYQNDPHNIFLSYGIPFGIGGIILISLILMMPFAKLYKISNSQAQRLLVLFFLPAFIAAVVHSLVEPTITAFGYGMLFWTMYALMFRFIKEPKSFIDEN